MDRQRLGLWATFILAILVVVGLAVQVYLIATFAFDSAGETGADAIDTHRDLGPIVHGVEILVFLAALVATWPNWRATGWPFALAVLGSVQAFHGAGAPIVFVIAVVIVWRTYLALRATTDATYAT